MCVIDVFPERSWVRLLIQNKAGGRGAGWSTNIVAPDPTTLKLDVGSRSISPKTEAHTGSQALAGRPLKTLQILTSFLPLSCSVSTFGQIPGESTNPC